ncbi:MAG: ATP-binding protein [Halobacteriales archaeon]
MARGLSNKESRLFLETLGKSLFEGHKCKDLLIIDHIGHYTVSMGPPWHTASDLFEIPSLLNEFGPRRVSWGDETPKNQYDMVFGFFPFGLHPRAATSMFEENDLYSDSVHLPKSAVTKTSEMEGIIASARMISKNGIGIFQVTGSYEFKLRKTNLEEILHEQGCYITCVINAPNHFYSYSPVRTTFVVISRKQHEKIFLMDLSGEKTLPSLQNYFEKIDGDDITKGVWELRENFDDFGSWYLRKALDSMPTGELEGTTEKDLKDLAKEINSGKFTKDTEFQHTERENAVYIPKIGTRPATTILDESSMKHQNYHQVIVDETQISAEYLCMYLNMPIGKQALSSRYTGTTIPKLSKSGLKTMPVIFTSLAEQAQLSEAHEAAIQKIRKKQEEADLATELATEKLHKNPLSMDSITKVIGSIEGTAELSKEDQIKEWVNIGENKHIEFKETFDLNKHTGNADKNLQHSALKTICAFLNTEGGVLLVGIHDKGEILGVDAECNRQKKGDDGFLLHINNLIDSRIGTLVNEAVSRRIVTVNSKKVLVFDCKPLPKGTSPVWLDGKELYYRTDPATRLLEGPDALEYIKKRFG